MSNQGGIVTPWSNQNQDPTVASPVYSAIAFLINLYQFISYRLHSDDKVFFCQHIDANVIFLFSSDRPITKHLECDHHHLNMNKIKEH